MRLSAELWRNNLCAGGPHGTAGNLDVKTTLGVFFSTEGGVVVRLPAGLPVTHRLANGLEDAVVTIQKLQ